jgi:hypothetical protein
LIGSYCEAVEAVCGGRFLIIDRCQLGAIDRGISAMHRVNPNGLRRISQEDTNGCFWTASATSLIERHPMQLAQAYSGTWTRKK